MSIASVDEAAAKKAVAIIEELTATAELNKTYLGKVVRVVEFGAFVEILPGTDGLLHVSEMAHHRVNDVRDEVKEGDEVLVKVINIDPSGKIRLSRKALIEAPAGEAGNGGGSEGGGEPRRDEPRGATTIAGPATTTGVAGVLAAATAAGTGTGPATGDGRRCRLPGRSGFGAVRPGVALAPR